MKYEFITIPAKQNRYFVHWRGTAPITITSRKIKFIALEIKSNKLFMCGRQFLLRKEIEKLIFGPVVY